MRYPCASGQQKTDCTELPTLAQRMHWRRCKMQGSADPCWMHWHKRLTKHRRAQRNHRQMHWHVCITIPQTLKGTQTLFVFNSVKSHLHLTALNSFVIPPDIAREDEDNALYISSHKNFTLR